VLFGPIYVEVEIALRLSVDIAERLSPVLSTTMALHPIA
jgi:hypothetical protein